MVLMLYVIEATAKEKLDYKLPTLNSVLFARM